MGHSHLGFLMQLKSVGSQSWSYVTASLLTGLLLSVISGPSGDWLGISLSLWLLPFVSLGFLKAWWSQGSWLYSFMVVGFPQGLLLLFQETQGKVV